MGFEDCVGRIEGAMHTCPIWLAFFCLAEVGELAREIFARPTDFTFECELG